ncbi:hypothetical protein QR680_010147 [Steinernema hermaphroditum]|uniref:F-box domain-containing protein n=1 Tax=Steinernema hermaphroditum TaxID=289476 RepID=A0AA39IPK5_9BILA|nr:hypothetical protein QR680_010147 [Steinernema hermaphroditum]
MNLLPYDLVDHLVQFLPRTDLKTIAKAASERLELSNWKLVAEHHLKERYLLTVDVYIPYENELQNAAKRRKVEEGEKASDQKEMVLVLVQRRSFTRTSAERWDFKRMKYASLGDVRIHSRGWIDRKQHRPCDVQKMLPILSLPVATRADSFVKSSFCVDNISSSRDIDLAMKMAEAVQKTFAKINVWTSAVGTHPRADSFIRDYINHQAFLEDAGFSCGGIQMYRISEDSIVSLFKERRTTPLTMHLPAETLSYSKIQEILEHWKNSDEDVAGHKELIMYANIWPILRREWQNDHGYLAHPTKRSSVRFSNRGFKIVKFEPWHLPVNSDWIDSVIENWKKSDGFFVFKGNHDIQVRMKDEEWDKLVDKYGPTTRSKPGFLPAIRHPSRFGSLQIRKDRRHRPGSAIEIKVIRRFLTDTGLGILTSKWEKSSGEFVVDVNQHKLKKIEVRMDPDTFRYTFYDVNGQCEAFVGHPKENVRLMVKEVWPIYRFSVVSIDTEEVDDWNLDLLFGSE